jgi:hypothetical protein
MLTSALLLSVLCAEPPVDPAAIMAKVAANVESAAEARRHYIYHQRVRSSLVRGSGDVARRENREYTAIPTEKHTEKKLESFQGEYRKGKQLVSYSEPGFEYKKIDIDGQVINQVTSDLVDDKNSRDGIPHSLFPLRAADLPFYRFSLKAETELKGRPAYLIAFEPLKKETCVEIGAKDDCPGEAWKGEAWIDREELQPVRIETHLAFSVPWGVRVFLGTNLKQTGFSLNYVRIAENVWFPATYGTEFGFNVLWGYRRTLTLSMKSDGFRKTNVDSKLIDP